ncbi:MAG: helix-turn-helix domain-containing protein [Thermoleophilaceae bacterium]
MSDQRSGPDDTVDVRRAAALVGRHPETIRRWVWSGRLAARREGNRLLVSRADVVAAASQGLPVVGLGEWADRARGAREASGSGRSGRGAADLVLEDRAHRTHEV